MGLENTPSWLIALVILVFTYGILYYFNGARFMNKFFWLWFLILGGSVLAGVVIWYMFYKKKEQEFLDDL